MEGPGQMTEIEQKMCELLKAMADSARFRILQYLNEKPRNVSEIVRTLSRQQSLVSHHLKVLRSNGLVETVRNGPFVQYSVSKPEIGRIMLLARKIVEENNFSPGGEK